MHPRPFHRSRRHLALSPPALGHPRRLRHRPFRRHLTGLLVSSFLIGAFSAVPATAAPAAPAELPPQEPG